jgi:hypothetical protein
MHACKVICMSMFRAMLVSDACASSSAFCVDTCQYAVYAFRATLADTVLLHVAV